MNVKGVASAPQFAQRTDSGPIPSTRVSGHSVPHPALKTIDAYQWLLLLAAHSARHTAQIEEVKADPNFPKK